MCIRDSICILDTVPAYIFIFIVVFEITGLLWYKISAVVCFYNQLIGPVAYLLLVAGACICTDFNLSLIHI